jgi:OmpA-OmpF porin, OOP family
MFKFFRSADEDSRQEWVIFGSLALLGLLAVGGVAWHKHRVHARHAEVMPKPAVALPTVLTRLRGDITPKSITLTGQVATEAEHQALVARATAAFPKLAVVDQISVAPAGVLAPMRWHEPTLGVLGEISSLRWGTLLCDNSLIKVEGDVVTEEAATDLKTKFAVHQAPGITFDPPNLKVMPAPKVEPEVLKGLVLKHLEGKVVEFETGSDKMTPKGRAVVDELAPELKDLTGLVIQVAGHTDNAGDPVKNLDLSERRAATVVAYLGTKGVDKAHLVAKGFGDSQPKASNDTPAGKQQNRRIEFLPEELH